MGYSCGNVAQRLFCGICEFPGHDVLDFLLTSLLQYLLPRLHKPRIRIPPFQARRHGNLPEERT